MPDISDVEDALCDVLLAVAYPAGIPPGPMPSSPTLGLPVRVFRGWPDSASEDLDLAAGIVNVSIGAEKGMSADRTRFDTEWRTVVEPVTTLTASVVGDTATFGGVPGVRQLAGIRVGSRGYSVLLGAADDPEAAAAALAAIAPGAQASGSVVRVPGTRLTARVAGFGRIQQEIGRQDQVFRICLWCPSQPARDRVAAALDASLRAQDWIPLPEHTGGRLRYRDTASYDAMSKSGLWRRDLRYSVEYPTVITQEAPAVMWGEVWHSDARSGAQFDATV